MKTAKTYRLSETALGNLKRLKALTGSNETALIEFAIAVLANHFRASQPSGQSVLREAIQAVQAEPDTLDDDEVNALFTACDGDGVEPEPEPIVEPARLPSNSKSRKRHKPKHGRNNQPAHSPVSRRMLIVRP